MFLDCSGKGWKPVFRCSFEKDFCGFTQSGMEWVRSKGKKNNDQYPEIPYDEYLPDSYFAYPKSTFLKEEYQKGTITIPLFLISFHIFICRNLRENFII